MEEDEDDVSDTAGDNLELPTIPYNDTPDTTYTEEATDTPTVGDIHENENN